MQGSESLLAPFPEAASCVPKTYREPTVLLVYIGAHSNPSERNSVPSSLEEPQSTELRSCTAWQNRNMNPAHLSLACCPRQAANANSKKRDKGLFLGDRLSQGGVLNMLGLRMSSCTLKDNGYLFMRAERDMIACMEVLAPLRLHIRPGSGWSWQISA